MTLDLSSRDRCYVIAEAGTCHAHPDFAQRRRRALDYAEAAADAGADCVKFQIFAAPILSDMFCRIDGDEKRVARWVDTTMRCWDWRIVKDHAERLGIDFLASVFQHRTVEWLAELGVKATKVASRAAANFPYENATGTVLVSNGMCAHPRPQNKPAYILECESKYPSDRAWEGTHPGFSAHSPTPDLAIDAIKRGCKLVEVHFYIDPAHAGRDLPASLTLDGLRAVCAARGDA